MAKAILRPAAVLLRQRAAPAVARRPAIVWATVTARRTARPYPATAPIHILASSQRVLFYNLNAPAWEGLPDARLGIPGLESSRNHRPRCATQSTRRAGR